MIADIITALAWYFLLVVATFAFYLAYCSVKRAIDYHILPYVSPPVRGCAIAIVIIGAVALDFPLNVAMSLVFLELLREFMLTMRCKRILKRGMGSSWINRWRFRVAMWFRDNLNAFEEGHI